MNAAFLSNSLYIFIKYDVNWTNVGLMIKSVYFIKVSTFRTKCNDIISFSLFYYIFSRLSFQKSLFRNSQI